MTAVTLTFFALFSLATIKVGIGLSKRFDAMDVYNLTSYVVAIGGIIGLVIYLTAMNAPDLGIQTLLWINSVILYIQSIGLFIIGYGMYKGRREFSGEGVGSPGWLKGAPRRCCGAPDWLLAPISRSRPALAPWIPGCTTPLATGR